MSWTWVWIGGALVLGFHLGVTLMSLLVMSRDSGSGGGLAISAPPGPEGKTMLNRGRLAAAAGSSREGFALKSLRRIPAACREAAGFPGGNSERSEME
jgi:hypothetical protein